MLIGRSKYADIRINERAMSQQHAKLVRWGDHHRIYDLGSTNGTFVNDQRVDEAELRSGDAVRTGETVFTYMGWSVQPGHRHTLAVPTTLERAHAAADAPARGEQPRSARRDRTRCAPMRPTGARAPKSRCSGPRRWTTRPRISRPRSCG